jgi:hypothetical protein
MIKSISVAVLGSVLVLGACAETATQAPVADRSKPAPSANIAKNAEVAARGLFAGQSDVKTFGSVSLGKTGNGWVVILNEDFRYGGSEAPKVGLGNNGYKTELAGLSSFKGRQVYAIPASVNVDEVSEVWIWDAAGKKGTGLASLVKN